MTLKLDWHFRDDKPRNPVHIPLEKDTQLIPGIVGIVSLALMVIAVSYVWGHAVGMGKGNALAAEAIEQARIAQDTAEIAKDSAVYWQGQAAETSAALSLAREAYADTLADLELAEARAEDASATVAELKRKAVVVPQSREVPKAPAKPVSGAWSRDKVESTLLAAAEHYGLTAAQTAWVVETGCRIAYRESTYRPSAVNASGCAGLFQFGPGWGSLERRLDPAWSCYRFVRVYRDGGEAAVRKHWAATV